MPNKSLDVWKAFHVSDGCWQVLFYVCFTFALGPLSAAIVLWRNSLVFHDVDKVTSVFIHIMPPLLMYCLKWKTLMYTQPGKLLRQSEADSQGCSH